VVRGKKKSSKYSIFGPTTPMWSPDGKTLVWSVMNSEGKARIVAGKQECGEERESVGAQASGGGSLSFLYASNNRRGLIFRDAAVPGLYDDLGTPAIDPAAG